MRCDQCKHWLSNDEDWTAKAVGFRPCGGVMARWKIEDDASKDISLTDMEKRRASEREALRAARAYVQDGSEYRAVLFTGPDFFCALFTPK